MTAVDKPVKFRTSVGAVFAAFLIFGSLQPLFTIAGDPLSHAVSYLINLIVHSDSLKMQESSPDWTLVTVNVGVSALYMACGLIIGSILLRRKRAAGS